MPFTKGQPRHPNAGRKQGSVNKKRLLSVNDFFCQKGIHPLEEIMKLMPTLDPNVQAKVWLEILEYGFPKVKPVEESELLPAAQIEFKLIGGDGAVIPVAELSNEQCLQLIDGISRHPLKQTETEDE